MTVHLYFMGNFDFEQPTNLGYMVFFSGYYNQNVEEIVQGTLFSEAGMDNSGGLAGGVGGLVAVRDIDLFSYCASCLLPFKVQCHVGYVPSCQLVVGLSKLSMVADAFAKRLQSPQRLADEICSALLTSIKPAGVAVALQCWHSNYPNKPTQGWVFASVLPGSGARESVALAHQLP